MSTTAHPTAHDARRPATRAPYARRATPAAASPGPRYRKVRGEGRYYELTGDGLRFVDLGLAREGGEYC